MEALWTWLIGKKTYLVALAMVAYALIGHYVLGSLDGNAEMQMILNALGLAGLRHGVATAIGSVLLDTPDSPASPPSA